ncbi:MAG: ATP-dependent helicase HrpB, partial [Ilumatobacteraceae bacterium]|nr:ATP-dependent helicase HrpB [Ilumatobacteraceae bacterium]
LPAAARDLPVVDVLPELGEALEHRGTALLVAPPGAGKTTVAPLWLIEQAWLKGRIVMLEPRRLATRAAAQRMAVLLGTEVGGLVGYQTRDERRIGRDTMIEVVTEGVLTRRLQHDPELPGVGMVIFDEVHERNVPTDIGLAFALDARDTVRPDLRLLAMSATPDVAKLTTVLGDAPTVESIGRTFPVDLRWLPMMKGTRVEQAAGDAVLRALNEEPGDVLVFLPGIGEIRRVEQSLSDRVGPNVDVRLLAGALSLAEQDLALMPSPSGRRRVVLSTDIAESSLTVSGVRIVVDAGLARVPRHDLGSGMTRLTTISTSRASADQRAGRSGRTEPGVAYRLWSKLEHATRRAHLEAEITQVDLAGVALELATWGTPVGELRFIDQPPQRALQQAHELLRRLGALDGNGRPTSTGRAMLALPLHPRLARMVVAAPDADKGLACLIAAVLDERDVLRGRADELPADLALRVRVVCGHDYHDRADRRDVARIRDRAADIARRSDVHIDFDDVVAEHTGAMLALAFPDRVAVRRRQPGQFQMRTGTGTWVAATDSLANERFIVAADLDGNRTSARVRIGAGIEPGELIRSLGDDVERQHILTWDKQRDNLVLHETVRLGSMLLEEQYRPAPFGDETVGALVERVRGTRLGVLNWTDAAQQLRRRLVFAASRLVDEWPSVDDKRLLATVDEWLVPFLHRATSRADLAAIDMEMVLTTMLSWDQRTELDRLVPATLTTAAGRTVVIDYQRDNPTVSVRVQDMFGTVTHPTIADGLPLTIELLSPADRPVQITNDLPGFWSGSWAMVRKELAGRYPKHQWPADPSTAVPKRLKDRPAD